MLTRLPHADHFPGVLPPLYRSSPNATSQILGLGMFSVGIASCVVALFVKDMPWTFRFVDVSLCVVYVLSLHCVVLVAQFETTCYRAHILRMH